MRIRGMNEETEELDDSLVNIKGDVYELTNGKVSIMEDPDTYKSTYQILQEISKVWDELTDKQQAQLLDKLFGKTRAQIGASIISNFSQAEAAIKTMSESAGAADREMDIIKNSLEYKINALKETFTGIWQNVFNREDLGTVVDFATGIAEVLDGITEKLGLFGSAIAAGGIAAGVMGLANAFKAFSAASGALTMVEALSGAFPGLSAAIGAFSTAMATTGGAAGVLHGALSGLWALIAAHPIIAAVGAIALLAVAFDKLHESASEANTKMDNSFQAYEDAQQKVQDVNTKLAETQAAMDALEQKGGLTFVEAAELENLKQATELLQIQADLAEKEEIKAAKQAAADTVNAYNKNIGKAYKKWDSEAEGWGIDNIYSVQGIRDLESKYLNAGFYSYDEYSGDGDIIKGLLAYEGAEQRRAEQYEEVKDLLKQNYDELSSDDQWAVDQYNDTVDYMNDVSSALWEQAEMLVKYKENLEKIPADQLTSEQAQTLREIDSAIGLLYQSLDPAKWDQIQFDKIFNHSKFAQAKQDLLDMALASDNLGITADDVKKVFGDYAGLEEELTNAGFTIEDVVNNINSQAEILDVQKVKENIKKNAAEAVEGAADEIEGEDTTVEPEVEVDPQVTVSNNADEKAKFDAWVDGLSDDYAIALSKLMADSNIDTSSWDTAAYQAYVESLMTGSSEAQESVADLTGTIQDLGLVFNDSSDTGLTKAISSYKEQMNSLVSAREKWNKGELSVEDMIGLQQSFAELNEFDMSNFGSGIDTVIDRITGKLGEADSTFKDFKENIIDKDEGLKDALADISSITKQGFKDAESDVTEVYGESVNMIMDAAARAGLVNRNSTESVNGFIDALFESGIIQGKTGEITKKTTGIMADFEKAIKAVGGEETIAGRALITMRDNLLGLYDQTDEVKSAYTTLKDTLGTFSQYQTDVAAALKASKSATGLTAEQVQTLTTAYEKLDSFQPDKLFEKTANGIHLNEEEFKRLNKEVQNNTLAQMYSDLAYKFDELNDAKAAGQDTSGLEKDIADAQMLIAQYEGLTSALNAWQQAQSNGNERDSFESVAKGYEGMEKILNQGWYGDESLNAYLDLMLSASERTGDAVADFEKLGQTIEGTGHSLKDYFTFEDGNLVSDGLFNFLDDVNAKMGDSFASIDENGNYMFDFTGEKLQQVADEFGTTTEFIQLMERAMIDAGMAVEMSSSSFETMKETLDGLQSEGKISPDIDLDIDTATASIEDIEGLIQSLESEKARIEVEADGTEETQQTLDTLDRTINTLNGQKITKSIQLAIENGNAVDELLAMDDTTLAATLNVDASEVDTARQQLEALNGATESTTVTVKLDSSQFDALTDTSQTVTVTYSVDAPEAPTYEDQNPSVTYGITAPTAPVYHNQNPSVTYHLSAPSAPYYPNMDRYITYHISTVGSAPSGGGGVDGTAHARGTAFANGNTSGDWGTKSSGVALGGELGEELLVRDGHFYTIGADSAEFFRYKKGDIIFNAEQTKEIFEKGKITHGSGRGEALVSGTAFDSGSGGRRRTSTASGGGSSGGGGRSSGGGGGSSGGGGGGGSSSSSSKDPDWMDWIEVKIDRIERKISKLKKNADNIYKSWNSRNKNLSKEISEVTKEITVQEKAYKRYIDQANSVGLDAGLAKRVREGTIDISKYDSDSETKKKIDLYKQWYDAALDCKDAIDDLNISLTELYEQQFDNIITKWENALQGLQHAAERTENIIDRRNAYASDYVSSSVARDASTQNIKDYRKLVNNAIKQRTKRNKELNELEKKLQSGIDKGTIKKGSEGYYSLLQQIQDIENEIDGLNADIIDYSNSISEEYKNMFDSLANDYENKLSLAEHLSNEYSNFLELAQARGYKTSTQYYQKLRNIELNNAKRATQLAKDLQKQLNTAIRSGEIKRGSQAWYDMTQQINDAVEAEQKATLAAQEYANEIRQIKWDKFDYLQEKISDITEESNFLIDLMKNADMFNDSGVITKEGMATAGLHAMNYNIDMNQADRYAKEIIAINKQIAKDPSNTDLIERKEELIKAQRDSIKAAENEKEAIKSLVSEGIKQELSYIKDLISKYNDALQSQKDLYDYQKKIKDQTSEISSLQKQLSAYANDVSEETRAKLQKIRVELDEKQEELEETEYERMISDTKKMLDDFYNEYETALNERLDNIDLLLQQVIDASNNNSTSISTTIRTVASEVGLKLSTELQNIWSKDKIDPVLSVYTHNYTSQLTTINSTIAGVSTAVNNLWQLADAEAKEKIAKAEAEKKAKEAAEKKAAEQAKTNKNNTKPAAKKATTTTTKKKVATTTTKKKKATTTTKKKVTTTTKKKATLTDSIKKHVAAAIWNGNYGWGNDPYRKQRLTEVFGSNNGIQKIVNKGYNYISGISPKGYSYTDMRKKFKGYESGAKRVGETGYVWTQEGQRETYLRASDHAVLTRVGADDRIYNAMASENLWQAANNPSKFIAHGISGLIGDMYGSTAGGKVEQHFDNISFIMPNVKNYDELVTQMQQDKKFEKLIKAMTVGQLNGKSSDAKYHFKFA